MTPQTIRAMQSHKWRIIVSIRREAKKQRSRKERPRPKRAKCHPRYYLLGG